jgi:hypothetical protein
MSGSIFNLSRADDLLLHRVVMGQCCHESATPNANARRGEFGLEQSISVECDGCQLEVEVYPRWDDDDDDFDDDGRRRKPPKPFEISNEQAIAVLQARIPCYTSNELLARQVFRKLEGLGWSPVVSRRGDLQLCTVNRGAIRIEGSPHKLYSEAVCNAALLLARSGELKRGAEVRR